MAATATPQQKQDNRKPNFQPNNLPESITAEVLVNGKALGTIAVSQGDKLSPKGHITFFGGISKGWKLPGDSSAALASLSFTVNGEKLTVSKNGVHADRAGNPCVFHTTAVALPNTAGEPVTYMVAITTTFRVAKGDYKLQILGSPLAIGGGGPVVRGEITGAFDIEGYEG